MDTLSRNHIEIVSQIWQVDQELLCSKFGGANEEFLEALTCFALFHDWGDCVSALELAWAKNGKTWSLELLQSVDSVADKANWNGDSDTITVLTSEGGSVCLEEEQSDVRRALMPASQSGESHPTGDIDVSLLTTSLSPPLQPGNPTLNCPVPRPTNLLGKRRKRKRPSQENNQQNTTKPSRRTRSSGHGAISSRSKSTQPLRDSHSPVVLHKSSFTIGMDALQRLMNEDGWVSDVVISGCLELLQTALGPSRIRTITSLAIEDAKEGNYGTATILAPIQLNHKANRHWVLVVIDQSENIARVFDPLPSIITMRAVQKILTDFCETIDIKPVTYFTSPLVQLSPSDCGILILIYAIHICANITIPLGQANITAWRRLIHLLLSPLSSPEKEILEGTDMEPIYGFETIEPHLELPKVDLPGFDNFMLSNLAVDDAWEKINELQTRMKSVVSSWQAVVKDEMDDLAREGATLGHLPSLEAFRTLQRLAIHQDNEDEEVGVTSDSKEAAIRLHRAVIYLQKKQFNEEKSHKLSQLNLTLEKYLTWAAW